jgi:hypothetical protein
MMAFANQFSLRVFESSIFESGTHCIKQQNLLTLFLKEYPSHRKSFDWTTEPLASRFAQSFAAHHPGSAMAVPA